MIVYAHGRWLQVSSSTHLLFCTTGILLRRLEEDPNLEGVTHIFVDEVHERSIESDFLLMVLRDMLRRNKKLRLCLMSATLDVDLFGRYFDNAPFVSIPGAELPWRPTVFACSANVIVVE